MAKRAARLSIRNLSTAIDQAVKIAVKEQGAKIGADSAIISKWELMGRRIKGLDSETAMAFSQTVAKQVSAKGFKVQPATLMLPKGEILCGFFPVEQFQDIQF
jgi:hypothetical protein